MNNNSIMLKIMRSTETQTDISIQVVKVQYVCNINPPALAATGAIPVISNLPMSHFFQEHVLIENFEANGRSTSYFLSQNTSDYITVDSCDQTILTGTQLYFMYMKVSAHSLTENNMDCNRLDVYNGNYMLPQQLQSNDTQTFWAHGLNYNPWHYRVPIQYGHLVYYNGYYYIPAYIQQIPDFSYLNLYSVCGQNSYYPTPYYNPTCSPQNICLINQSRVEAEQIKYDINQNSDTNNDFAKEITDGVYNLALQSDNCSNATPTKADQIPKLNEFCGFCRTNGETRAMYTSHKLRSIKADATIIECPVLRKYICKLCKATGDEAHTESHCPQNNNKKINCTAKIVTRTPLNSSGSQRGLASLQNDNKF